MPDLDHTWGNDLTVSPSGDIALVDGSELTKQRVIRRLMTRGFQVASLNQQATTGELIYHQPYGAGVPQRIGSITNIPLIKSIIRAQILLETSVAKSPAPVITVVGYLNGVAVSIQYTEAVSGQQTSLSFNLNG